MVGPLPHMLAFYGLIIEQEAFKKHFTILSKRGLAAIRFVDKETLEVLGVLYNISHLFNFISWDYVLSLDCPTYELLTLEILSTLSVYYECTSNYPPHVIFQLDWTLQ